jgi:LysR family transcriptional regulator, transcriptional activator for dmlA
MNTLSELEFFTQLVKLGSLTAAARELDLTPPAVSKRLAQLEARLGVRLLNRTTRRISVTNEGEVYLNHAQRILAEIEEMEQMVTSSRAAPKGLVRVNTTLGFGRSYIAPRISAFLRQYPEVEVQLMLTDRPQNLNEGEFDVVIRFGEPPDARVIARKIAPNRRFLCASPRYLAHAPALNVPDDLTQHNCIVLRQNDSAYGIWRFAKGSESTTVKVHGNLSSNDGEVALLWALEGHGVLIRAEWDIAKYLRSGRLVRLLEDYELPQADIFAVYPERHYLSAKVKVFIDFLVEQFARQLEPRTQDDMRW